MRRVEHALLSPSLGVHKTLTSLHFGHAGTGRKVYIQASLHAEELPGMLVAHHLRVILEAADSAGAVLGEVVLVPVANPIGLAQRVDHKPMGRFDLDTSENFNRHYPDLAAAVWPQVRSRLGSDASANQAAVRQAIAQFLERWTPATELESLRHTLLRLAHDADDVLDLHCDCEAVMHLYTEEPSWPHFEPLARHLQCEAVLLARHSGGSPFDECLSGVWWRLAERVRAEGLQAPLPQACNSTTVELRGETDVSHVLAARDAQSIADYLRHTGVLRDCAAAALPEAICTATPLAGSETLTTPVPGVLVFLAEVGAMLGLGDPVAEVVNPVDSQVRRIVARTGGVFYARVRERYVVAGGEVGKIAGATAFRTGDLLGA